VLLVLAVVAVLAFTLGGGSDAGSVEEVADAAVEAAEELDLDAGVELMCDPPSDDERERVEGWIESAQDAAGTEDPDVEYDVSEIEGDEEGSFVVTITSTDEPLDEVTGHIEVEVASEDGHSCIADAQLDVEEDDEAETGSSSVVPETSGGP